MINRVLIIPLYLNKSFSSFDLKTFFIFFFKLLISLSPCLDKRFVLSLEIYPWLPKIIPLRVLHNAERGVLSSLIPRIILRLTILHKLLIIRWSFKPKNQLVLVLLLPASLLNTRSLFSLIPWQTGSLVVYILYMSVYLPFLLSMKEINGTNA